MKGMCLLLMEILFLSDWRGGSFPNSASISVRDLEQNRLPVRTAMDYS